MMRNTTNTHSGSKLLNIGFGNVVMASRIVAVVTPTSAPMKRLREEARVAGKLVDATHGRRTRAIVITDSDHVILSAIQAETVAHRLQCALDPTDDRAEASDQSGRDNQTRRRGVADE